MPYLTTALDPSSFRVPSDIAAVPGARRRVVALVRGWCVPLTEDDVETLELLAGEVIGNAVAHTRKGCQVSVGWNGARVRLEVEDSGRDLLPVQAPVGPDAEGGRGLQLVAALAQAWGSRPTTYGKSVWFEVGASSSPPRSSHPPYASTCLSGAAQRAAATGRGPRTGSLPQTT